MANAIGGGAIFTNEINLSALMVRTLVDVYSRVALAPLTAPSSPSKWKRRLKRIKFMVNLEGVKRDRVRKEAYH